MKTAGRERPCGSRNAKAAAPPEPPTRFSARSGSFAARHGPPKSTFGRLVVNDGKLVSRLRDGEPGSRPAPLDKVRAYLSEHRAAPPFAIRQPSAAVAVNGAAAVTDIAPPASGSSITGKNICCSSRPASEKTEIATAFRLSLAICNPPAARAAAVSTPGSATAPCCRGMMRALHARFPTMPLYVVAKEISFEDVRMMLEKMADRLFEHPATVPCRHQPLLCRGAVADARSATAAQGLIWKDVALTGNTAHGFASRSASSKGFDRELARRDQPDHRQPALYAPHRSDVATRGSLFPARSDHAAARTGDGRLRSGAGLAALSGARQRRIQGVNGGDAAGAGRCGPAAG